MVFLIVITDLFQIETAKGANPGPMAIANEEKHYKKPSVLCPFSFSKTYF